MKANDLSRFNFYRAGYGIYIVVYTTMRGDYWSATIDYMPLIDSTLHAECAKKSDIKHLRRAVQTRGTHYSKNGKRID